MGKLEEPDEDEKKSKSKKIEAHITSLSVLRSHRKLGIATKLMRGAHQQMINIYKCDLCSLRVRVTNRAAITLYQHVLGYQNRGTDLKYYQDGEDAYDMAITFPKEGIESKDDEKNEEKALTQDKGTKSNFLLAESNPDKDIKTAADKKGKEESKEESKEEDPEKAASKAAKNKKKRQKAKAKKAAEKANQEEESKEA